MSGMALVYATVGMGVEIPALRHDAEESLAGPLGEFLASTVRADFGFVELAGGNHEKAAGDFSRGLEASSTTYFFERPRLLAGQALALGELGELDRAEQALTEGERFVDEKSVDLYRALLGYARARLLARRGESKAASSALAAAQPRAMEMGQRLLLIQILQARAELAGAKSDADHVQPLLRQAKSIVESIAGEVTDPTLRDGFTGRWMDQLGVGDIEVST
jgi:ATP/maltotriose-dependent transcriptional regulator MalT